MELEIERVSSAGYRLPLDDVGDAGHGLLETEELITVEIEAGGLTGHGYAYTIGRGGRAIQAVIDHDLTPLLMGQDAADLEHLWELMWQRMLYVGRGGVTAFAIAAVDIALWDLRGLSEGRPLYRTLGAPHKVLPAYGSGVDLPKSLADLLAQTEGFLDRGFEGVKVKVGRDDPAEDEERVGAVRDLVGDQVDLMIDANMAWDVDEAIERGRRLERHDPYWYEEPTVPEDVAGHVRMRRELTVPIAAGESLHSPREFERYVEADALDVVQVDPITCGGITAALRAIRLANDAGLPVSSHYADELSAHVLCAADAPVYLEKHAFALDPYLVEPQVVSDGTVQPTGTPGTGLRFDESALAPFRVA